MQNKNLLIAGTCLLTGFIAAYYIFNDSSTNNLDGTLANNPDDSLTGDSYKVSNPFLASDDNRMERLESEVIDLKKQIKKIELTLQDLITVESPSSNSSQPVLTNRTRVGSTFSRRMYNLDQLD